MLDMGSFEKCHECKASAPVAGLGLGFHCSGCFGALGLEEGMDKAGYLEKIYACDGEVIPDKAQKKWSSMIKRCCDPFTKDSSSGFAQEVCLTVCKEWRHDPVALYEWLTVNGFDQNKSWQKLKLKAGENVYSPETCEFVSEGEPPKWFLKGEERKGSGQKKEGFVTRMAALAGLNDMSILLGMPYRRMHYWARLISRTMNPEDKQYWFFAKRGCGVCEEWQKNPRALWDWLISAGYVEGVKGQAIKPKKYSLGFSPENCYIAMTNKAKAEIQGKERVA